MLFDELRLNGALEEYKRDFPKWWKKGKDKWVAVETFQKYWDDKASDADFPKMLSNALSKTQKIMVAWGGSDAKKAIINLAREASKETFDLFKELFDENRDVLDRIQAFKKKSADLYRQHGGSGKQQLQGENRQRGGSGKQQLQGENTITTYLWLRYPDKYYIYRINALCALAAKIGFIHSFREGPDSGHLNDKKRLKEFYDLYDEICSYISKDDELINMVNKNLAGMEYKDLEHKTLTADFAFYIYEQEKNKNPHTGYWLMVAKSDDGSLSSVSDGVVQHYFLKNKKGEYRQIKRNLLNVKAGDKVIDYEPYPTEKIVALAEIVEDQKGDDIKIRKNRNVTTDVNYNKLKRIPELQNMEFLRIRTGSFFKLEENEYNCLMKLIDDTYVPPEEPPLGTGSKTNSKKYTAEDFLDEVFITETQYNHLVKILDQKKNIILKGVPGVGKTFAAERLVYSMMGEKDDSRIQLIQFHQSYSYEDFIEGYKPGEGGSFTLEKGVFYEFCKKAAADKEKRPFFFIIDEINRGNISKIFGELMMTLEYRGKEVVLAYSKEKFFIPENLYIIGMMNTADRSIAMIDYALRRRFCHFELEPAFNTKTGMKKFKTWLRNNGSNKKDLTKLITKIRKLNSEIAKDLGKGFCIGHSYFCKKNLTKEDLKLIVNYEIIPTLEQYWLDEPYKAIGWIKLLRDEISISEVGKDDFEEKMKEELEAEEEKELKELEAEEEKELKELEAEEKEDNNAEGNAER